DVAASVALIANAVGLSGDQIDGTGGRGAEVGVIGIVAHGIALGVVPKRCHGVAVVVAHDQGGRRVAGRRRSCRPRKLREGVHQTGVEGLLLGRVVVVLIVG